MLPRRPFISTFGPKMQFLETYQALADPDGCAKVENGLIIMVYIRTNHMDLVLTLSAPISGSQGFYMVQILT
jgi:hypothetical protein